jgi:hypothetical protein
MRLCWLEMGRGGRIEFLGKLMACVPWIGILLVHSKVVPDGHVEIDLLFGTSFSWLFLELVVWLSILVSNM